MKRHIMCSVLVLALIIGVNSAAQTPAAVYKEGPVKAKMIDAGFIYGDSNYHAIIQASDGNVYYVICSHNKKSGAHMFKYDPRTGRVETISDLTEEVGEDRTIGICQGKVHGDFYETRGKLYFSTHAGAYDETYPGGHHMCYDLKTGKFEDFGIGLRAQGNVAMAMDTKRGRMYAITWPGYLFTYYDINTGKTEVWGKSYCPVEQQGPRSLAIDPRTGNVYWHNTDDTIECYTYKTGIVRTLDKPRFSGAMYLVPFGKQGYNVNHVWRSIRWSDSFKKFYGVMYNTDWLFSFEPVTAELEIIDRIAAGPNRKYGTTIYSSLAYELSKDGKTAYYIAHQDVVKPDSSTVQELHLVTYDIPLRHYTDHGAIELDDGRRPRYCQGLEVGTDGSLYIVCWIPFYDVKSEKGRKILDLATGGKPALEIERSKNLQEINLIVMKNPLAGRR
jgi:hypothetical protein